MRHNPDPAPPSLRNRLVLWLILLAVLMTAAAMVVHALVFARLEAESRERNMNMAHLVAMDVREFLRLPSANLIQIKGMLDEGVSGDRLDTLLNSAVRFSDAFDLILVTDRDGHVLSTAPYRPESIGLDVSKQPFFQNAMAGRDLYWSDSFISAQTQSSTVCAAVPWRGGVVAAYLSLRQISAKAALPFRGRPGYVAVVDRRGTVLGHSDIRAVERSENLMNLEPVRAGLHGEEAGYSYGKGAEAGYYGVSPIEAAGWAAVVFQPRDEALRPMWRYRPYLAGLLIAAFAVTAWLLLAMRRHLLQPFSDLAVKADHLANGDFSQDMRPAFQEMAGLTASFNRMAATLKQRETALRESSERLDAAIDGADLGVWELSVTAGLVIVNDRLAAMLGFAPGEMATDQDFWKQFVHPGDMPTLRDNVSACLEDPARTFECEFRMKTRNGEWRWFLSRGRPVGDSGSGIRLLGVCQDVTRRKAAELELQRSSDFLGDIIDSMPSIIVGVDCDCRVTRMNAVAEKLAGMDWRQASGRLLDDILPQLATLAGRINTAVREGGGLVLDRVPLQSAGRIQIYDLKIYPLRRKDEGAVIRLDDASDRARLEEMAIQTEKMLTIGGLAAGMAHEINNPLGGILSAVQNALRRLAPGLPGNEQAAERAGINMASLTAYLEARGIIGYLKGIKEMGERSARIVSNMLSFSRPSEGRMVRADLSQVLDRAIDLAGTDYDPSKNCDIRKLEIRRDYSPELGPVPCRPGEIEQVVLNLLTNAAQAMTQTGHTITLRLRRDDPWARIEVEDDGPGMPETVRRRVFEPFFTTKDVGRGTGLGLAVSYFIIVNTHRGEITVDSEPGQGTRFSIRLPLSQGDDEDLAAPPGPV